MYSPKKCLTALCEKVGSYSASKGKKLLKFLIHYYVNRDGVVCFLLLSWHIVVI